VVGSPQFSRVAEVIPPPAERRWLVHFTEPYGSEGWRLDEVYRDLLPGLMALSQACSLKLVFKLHPYESIEGHRRMLRRFLTRDQARQVEVLSGPISPGLWQKMRFAITAQSTVALECAALGIPVFLCGWLRSPCGGYVQQYTRYSIGHLLNSPAEMSDIPRLLEAEPRPGDSRSTIWQGVDPADLQSLLNGTYSLRAANAS
jgi:hypothetical protein